MDLELIYPLPRLSAREIVSEPDHFFITSDFLEKYLSDFQNFSIFLKLR